MRFFSFLAVILSLFSFLRYFFLSSVSFVLLLSLSLCVSSFFLYFIINLLPFSLYFFSLSFFSLILSCPLFLSIPCFIHSSIIPFFPFLALIMTVCVYSPHYSSKLRGLVNSSSVLTQLRHVVVGQLFI